MKTHVYFLLLSLFTAFAASAQALVITDSTTTPSICFNDGTITVSASGGTGNYTFTITNGPSYPNITYPITLPALDSVFLTMPAGEYTIKVTDGSGQSATATATVGGTYTFPVINAPDTSYSPCITVTAQGGRLPYEFAISSTGTNSGFGPYQSSGTFCHLCNGTYWIRVKDSCQNIFTTNKIIVIVPVPTYSVTYRTIGNMDSVNVNLVTTGAPPYTYTLTSGSLNITNETGKFFIPVSCLPDNITVRDSCGRTFQTTINIHSLYVGIFSNCQSGTALLEIDSEAIGPFTITGSNGTLVTDQYQVSITGLPLDSIYTFTIKDSCGNTQVIVQPCSSVVSDTVFFYNICPFDSSIHMTHDPVSYCYPVVVTCLSCSPVQIDTIYSTVARVFTGIDTGVAYTIKIQDQCGFDYTTVDVPGYEPLSIADSILTCSDFKVYSTPPVFTPPIHYSVYDVGTLVDSATADAPIFYHLPPATYQVTATQPLCLATSITVKLPALGGSCAVPMFDSACRPTYAIYQALTEYVETYSLVSTANNATYIQKAPNPYPGAVVFDNVPPGNYDLISDSGCSVPYVLPPFPQHQLSATAITQCSGATLIQVSCSPPISSCNTSQGAYYVLRKNNQFIDGGNNGRFSVLDTGYYVVDLFLSNTSIFSFNVSYDTICPVDTILVYVSGDIQPNIVAQTIEVCGNVNADIPFTIFGGTPPYTVQILGYPTQTDSLPNDTFPNVSPGIYTMIVSDYCGISRSFSVSVIDTCTAVCDSDRAAFILTDSILCTGASVSLANQSRGASHYQWTINGSPYTNAVDTAFTAPASGSYTVMLYAYIGPCADSAMHTISVQDTLHSIGETDTTLCSPFALTLNTHIANTLWSTGPTDSVITVTDTGIYIASLTNACGTTSDTVAVHGHPVISGFSLTDDRDRLCEGVADSSLVTASIDSSGQPPVIFTWTTGQADSAAYSSGFFVYQPGSYTVTANNGFCPLTKSITIDSMACDSECIAGIAIPDIFTPNGDGKNDTFFILHICDLDPFEMHIYDRFGMLVFQSSDSKIGWDGKYKGAPEPEEVYWLWLQMTLPDGKKIYRSGSITLVR